MLPTTFCGKQKPPLKIVFKSKEFLPTICYEQKKTWKRIVPFKIWPFWGSISWISEVSLIDLLKKIVYTLPETNISPENRPLEKEIPVGNHHFLGAMLVSGRVRTPETAMPPTFRRFNMEEKFFFGPIFLRQTPREMQRRGALLGCPVGS